MNHPTTPPPRRTTTVALFSAIVALGAMACGPVTYEQGGEQPIPSDYRRPGPSEIADFEYSSHCFLAATNRSNFDARMTFSATEFANEGWRIVDLIDNGTFVCFLGERPVSRTQQPDLDRVPTQPLVGEPSNP